MKKKSHSAILEKHKAKPVKKKKKSFNPTPSVFFILLVFFLALSVRLIFLLVFTRIDQPLVGDVWHHWQIAYLSKTIGFKQGFLRLWDFKGMEYYWGLLHPLILIAFFKVTGSVSIIIPRIVSTLFGSGVITLVFLIVARHFNKKAAFASALFIILMPTTIFHDTLGLQEPLGLFFLLLGVYLFPTHSFSAGFTWMLAGMVRAEYWVFGAALIFVVLIRERNFDRKVIALIGFTIPCLLYMKYMLDYTGNPIYPIYWNYLAITLGEWSSTAGGLNASLQSIQLVSQILTGFFFVGALIVIWRKFKSYLFILMGLASITFSFFTLGFGAYIYGFDRVRSYPDFIDRIWIGKIFAFPWGFLGILMAIFLLYFLPKKIGKIGTLLGTSILLIVMVVLQFAWPSISKHYLEASFVAEASEKAAAAIANEYTGEGKLFLPAQAEYLTYFLVYNEKILGERLVSSFYDPFYYYKGEDPFSEWDTFREELVDWFVKEDAEIIVISEHEIRLGKTRVRNYARMLELEEDKLFELVATEGIYRIYKVNINEE